MSELNFTLDCKIILRYGKISIVKNDVWFGGISIDRIFRIHHYRHKEKNVITEYGITLCYVKEQDKHEKCLYDPFHRNFSHDPQNSDYFIIRCLSQEIVDYLHKCINDLIYMHCLFRNLVFYITDKDGDEIPVIIDTCYSGGKLTDYIIKKVSGIVLKYRRLSEIRDRIEIIIDISKKFQQGVIYEKAIKMLEEFKSLEEIPELKF